MLYWLIPLAIIVLFVYLTHPSMNYGKCRRWRGAQFAHRGLHDPGKGIVENTLQAFEAARDAGYGMELDIQFSKDMRVVVFHDDDLLRLTGDPRAVRAVDLAELQAMPLSGRADAHIPTLRQVLDAVDGRVPLLIELKSGRDNPLLCKALMEHLRGYRGEYLVESFDPRIVAWFRFRAPGLTRGQLVCAPEGYRPKASAVAASFMAGLLVNCLGRPDFVAYDANAEHFLPPRLQRGLYRTPMAAWTVRDPALARAVTDRGEMNIFEGKGRIQ